MAIKKHIPGRNKLYFCKSTDTKPTSGIALGTGMFETDTGVKYIFEGPEWVKKTSSAIDSITNAINTISYAHHETHGGSRFFRTYSVASLGAMTTPADMITLTWTTPDTTKWEHFTFYVIGTGGWIIKLIEGSTGGGATPTDHVSMLNHNRNSSKVATCIDLNASDGNVSRDATQLTGGTELWTEYIPGGSKMAGSVTGGERDEILLKQNEIYQLSCFGIDTDPCTIHIDWYEHTNK